MSDDLHQQNPTMIEDVIHQELAWAQALRDLNLNVIADIASEKYRQRQVDGTFLGKAELLASLRSGYRSWEVAESTNHHVQISNGLAIVLGKWHGVGTNSGERFDYRARFLSIYQLENGTWRMILDQSMPES